MYAHYGSVFRTLRENINISISSLADDEVSKGMISKFERSESDISVSRFFHLLDKIKVRPEEFFFAKNQYRPESFSILLLTIQQAALSSNVKKLRQLLTQEQQYYNASHNLYHQLNSIMLKAAIHNIDSNTVTLTAEELHTLSDYLFKCDNWGYYELTLYANSMSAFSIDAIIEFSKSIPQRILLLRSSSKLLEIGFNVLLNTLDLCIKHHKQAASRYFLASLEQLNLPEIMVFELTLLQLYKGIYLRKFNLESPDDAHLIEDALNVFKLVGCTELHDIFAQNAKDLLV